MTADLARLRERLPWIASQMRDSGMYTQATEIESIVPLLTEIEGLRRDAERYLDAIFKMADDGWLMHGVEGMSEAQEAVYEIAQEHPTYKERSAIDAAKDAK